MPTICPAILAENSQEYTQQLVNVDFVDRLHIDFMNSTLSDSRSIALTDASWGRDKLADLHIMFARPQDSTQEIARLRPHLVIIHTESDCDIREFMSEMLALGVKVGLAILPETGVDIIEPYIDELSHVLIFSGHLGHFGGQADLSLLAKVAEVKSLNPDIEVGWDGGVNAQNITQIAEAGVDVINVGGFIQKAEDSGEAYETLAKALD